MAIDRRIINLGIEVDGDLRWYGGLNSPLYIEAKGQNFASPAMGECDITVLGVTRDVRDYVLQNTKPLNRNAVRVGVVLEVGRESYGTHTRYTGDVFRSEMIGKPDVGLRLICRTGYFNKSKMVTRSGSELTKLSSICQWVADDCGYGLSFDIDDRNIGSYSFTGSAQSQLEQLEKLCDAEVFVESGTIHVKQTGEPATGKALRLANVQNGLLQAGPSEAGVKIDMLYDPVTTIGTQVDLESSLNPSIDGSYIVYRSAYHVANRADPFYLNVECNPKL